MAMLAEPRRKQKWTLNPRGKQWSDDSTKFGQKMLEKMGWTSGKGLGASEQGMTEHVRVKFKADQAGIGFSQSNQDKLWTEHQESFNELLQNLQTTGDSSTIEKTTTVNDKDKEMQTQSLELKSKQSRARVHYQKFTRGKDVNRYSKKDLANIFGKKDLDESDKVNENKNKVKVEQSSSSVGLTDTSNGVLTIMGGTINDYFKQKMPAISTLKIKSEKDEVAASESDSERYVGFGFSRTKMQVAKESSGKNDYAFVNPALDLNNSDDMTRKRKSEPCLESSLNEENVVENNHKRKKRKTLNSFAFENSALDLESPKQLKSEKRNEEVLSTSLIIKSEEACISQNNGNNENNVAVISTSKSLQKQMSGLENNALDLTDEINGKKRVTFNDTIEYNTDSVSTNKTKHKKRKIKKLDKFEVDLDESAKKKNKKLKNISLTPEKNSFVNEALDVEEVINEELIDNEANERRSKKIKRKKNKPVLHLDTIDEEDSAVTVKSEFNATNSEGSCTHEKKKNENSSTKIVMDRNLELVGIDTSEINECSQDAVLKVNKVKKKAKEAKKKHEIVQMQSDVNENGNENKNEAILNTAHDYSEIKVKKEKKKKKNKSTNESVDENSSVIKAEENIYESNCIKDYKLSHDNVVAPETKKQKKKLKALFAQSPIINFIGSNINELKGYGVE